MKNISFLLVLAFIFLTYIARAQPTFYISPEFQLVDQNDQVCYELKTRDFSFLLSASFTITWDPGVLSNATVTPGSLHPDVTGLDMNDFEIFNDEGYLTFQWSNGQPCDVDDPTLNETIADDEVLFEICFIATGIYGNHTPLKITDEPIDLDVKRYNANCQNIMPSEGFTFDGFLSIGTEPLMVNISSADGFQGETVCIDFTVENFDNLVSTQYYIFWNPNVMLFENALPSNIPGFGPGNLGWDFADEGLGVVSWNAVGSPVSIPDGTQILQLCFKIIGQCGQSSPIYIDDNGDDMIEIVDMITDNSNGTNIGLLDSPGEVSVKCFNPNGINLTVEDKDVCPGETFTVDITADNFEDIVKLQFDLKWNPSVIQLLNTSGDGISFPAGEPCFQFDSPGTLTVLPSQGKISVDWDGGLFGCDVPDGSILMRLHFRAVGSGGTNSTVAIVQPILVDLVGGQVVNVGINNDNGLVSICQLNSPTLIAQGGDGNPGEEICLQITTQDFDDITKAFFNLSWEPNDLSYVGVQNFSLPGLDNNSFLINPLPSSGDLGVTWEGPGPVSVPDGTVLFDICFEIIGDPDSCSLLLFTDYFVPIDIQTAQSNGTNVGLNGQGSEVCVLDPFDFLLRAEDVYGTPGSQVTVDIIPENFLQLTRIKHSLSWKSDILQYDSLTSTGAIPNFSNIHFDDSPPAINNGQMIIDWSTNDINGVTVPDGQAIYTLHFTIIGNPGECSGVKIDDWLTTFLVRSALTGSANLGLETQNGSVCVNQSFLTLANSEVTNVDCPSNPSGAIDLTVAGASGNYSYSWEGPGVVPTAEDQTGLSPGFYHVTITDVENPSLHLELDFQVELSPMAPVADAGQDTSFSCIAGVATLTLNGTGSTQSGVTYMWDNGPGFPGIITNGQNTPTPTVIGGSSYILTVTQPSTGCVVSDTVEVAPPVKPEPNILDSEIMEISCTHDTIFLNGGQPQNIFEFEWIAGPGGHIVPGSDTSMQPLITMPGWYYLHMYHPFSGCEGTDSIFIEDKRIFPDAAISGDNVIGCDDEEILLDANGSTLDNTTFQWMIADGAQICGPVHQPVVNACAPGTYQVVVTDTLTGCSSLAQLVVEGDTLRPTAIAGPAPDTSLTCVVSQITLDGSASTQGPDMEYYWINEAGDTLSTELTYLTDAPGLFTLVVMDVSNGCQATSQILVTDDRILPTAVASAGNPITCAVDTTTLDGNGSSAGPEFAYQWLDPTGNTISNDLTVLVSDPGTYTLIVSNIQNQCTREVIVEVEDQNDPVPVEAGDAEMLGCAGGVQLNGSFSSPNQGVQLQWSGPGIGCISDGTIPNPVVECTGTYVMTVYDSATGCTGTDSLVVMPDQNPPAVDAGEDDTFPCSLSELMLAGTTDQQDVVIEWTTTDGSIIQNPNSLTPTVGGPGTYLLTVTSNANQCSATDFVVIAQPDMPVALIEGDTIADCAQPSVTLSATGSAPGVTYFWVALSGNIPAGQETEPQITVPAGEYVLTVTDMNQCTGTDSHLVLPGGDLPVADAGADIELPCDSDFVQLDGSSSDPGLSYQWTDAQGTIIGSDLVVQVTSPGVYTLLVTNPDNQCQSADTVVVTAATTSVPAEASFDHDPCAIEAILMGNLPSGATGVWTTQTGALIEDPNAAVTLATNLIEGDNIFNWTLSLGNCVDYSTDQVIISIDHSVPDPTNDFVTLQPGAGGTVTTNVLENDNYDPSLTTFHLISENFPGEVDATAEGLITFTKLKCFIGTVELQYELCNVDCPELCQTATLSIEVLPDDADNCDEVPNGITPNGDGINDVFIFDDLLNTTVEYPNNEFIVFNRWGDIVFRASPYLNDWAGTNNAGQPLPHGTYYYILNLDIANSKIIRGDVTILK